MAPWSAIAADADRRRIGLAAELRIGLDLAAEPGYLDLLSFLPPKELRTLLCGAGYSLADYDNLADTGTADPLLLGWVRSSHPIAWIMPSGQLWPVAGMQPWYLTWWNLSASVRFNCAAHSSFTCAVT